MTGSQSRVLRALGLAVVVVAVAVAGIGVLSGTAAAASSPDCGTVSYDSGDGTANSPYEISTLNQTQCIGANHSDASNLSDALGSNYTLVSDIDASNTSSWNGGNGFDPIGNDSDPFVGAFDGDGYNITELKIDRGSTDYVGLFGEVGSAGSIENVGLEDANVTGQDYVGGLVGENNGGSVNGSYATGNVSGSGNYVGGLVGENNGGSVNASNATAAVDGSGYVGGLVGQNWVGATVERSHATGTVTGSGNFIGGLVGYNRDTTVNESYATGNVSGTDKVGGLAGYNNDVVNATYATGSVDGSTTVGGLVGKNFGGGGGGTVQESYATGTVSGDSNVGGLVGLNNSQSTSGTVTDSYWDVNTTNQATSEGSGATGLTTSQLKGNDSLAGFRFGTTWAVVNTNDEISYPYLQNNAQSPEPGRESRYAGGDGTTTSPYRIADWSHLNETRRNPDANFTLANSLNDSTAGYSDVASASANDGDGFLPIGNSSTAFTGTLDGNGHNITGLRIDRGSTDNVSLFGVVGSAGNIENAGLEDANVTGQDSVGGLVGYNDGGTVNASSAGGNVSGTSNDVGGLVGYNDAGTVNESSATAAVSGDSGDVGGLVGENNQGTVNGSHATGAVNGSDADVGGLVGKNNFGTIDGSYATGAVNSSDSSVGGLVGDNEGSVDGSYATGAVNGSGNQVGGLVGRSAGSVNGSYATGDVSGTDNVGGLVGDVTQASVVDESYATGAVDGNKNVGGLVGVIRSSGSATATYATGAVNGSTNVGGLVGKNSGTVSQSYATGSVSGSTHVGGLVGQEASSQTVTNSYWDTTTTGQSDGVGLNNGATDVTGLTTSEMKGSNAKSNMDGLVSSSTWTVLDTSSAVSYPYLQDNTQQPEPGRESVSDDGGGDGGDGSDGTGAGGVQDEQEEEEGEEGQEDPATTVATQKTETEGGEEARGTVESAEAGETVGVETDVSSDSGDSTLDSLNVEFADDVDDATVTVSKTDDSPSSTPDLDAGEDIGYMDVNLDVEADDVAESEFNFRVSDERIEDADGPENIQMYRFNDGEYRPLPTRHRGGNQFGALTSGFSVFAIGTTPPNISATGGSVNPAAAEAGDSITAVVTLRNSGGDDGSEVVRLIADNSPLTSESVVVPPGGEVTVDLSATLGQPGTYDIATNLIDLGTVDVANGSVTTAPDESGTPTPGPEPGGEETTPDSGTPTPTAAPGFFGPGFGPVATLLALCALALLGLLRRD